MCVQDGTYIFASPLLIDGPVTVRGTNRAAVHFQAATASAGNCTDNNTSVSVVIMSNGAILESVHVDGGGTRPAIVALGTSRANRPIVRTVDIEANNCKGIRVDGHAYVGPDINISNVNDGVFATGAGEVIIDRASISHNGHYGIKMEGQTNLTLSSVDIAGALRFGVDITSSSTSFHTLIGLTTIGHDYGVAINSEAARVLIRQSTFRDSVGIATRQAVQLSLGNATTCGQNDLSKVTKVGLCLAGVQSVAGYGNTWTGGQLNKVLGPNLGSCDCFDSIEALGTSDVVLCTQSLAFDDNTCN